MFFVLPHIQEAPEIRMQSENDDFMNTNNSIVVTKWEEDSTDHVKLTTFFPLKETSNTRKILNNCYMKGRHENEMF